MKVLGLTGSIAMGKSTVADMVAAMGVPVFDADRVAHVLLRHDPAVIKAVKKLAPKAVSKGKVDREILARKVFKHPKKLKKLEAILHPRVGKARRQFLGLMRRMGRKLVVLDVPLLYETRGERYCDAVAVVSAPHYRQRDRLMARPGMTETRMRSILKRQMADVIKRRRADHVIATGTSLWETRRQLRIIIRSMGG